MTTSWCVPSPTPVTRFAIGRAGTTGRISCKIRATCSWPPAATGPCATSRLAATEARVPFAVLLFGTANNISKSLGLIGRTSDLVAAWTDDDARAAFAIGEV